MKTVYILVRHLECQVDSSLELAKGRIERIPQGPRGRQLLVKCQELFPSVTAEPSDWLYRREYDCTPSARMGADPSGCGDIPYQSEDLLLALRLLQPGDISFVAQTTIVHDKQPQFQSRYRYFGEIESTNPYWLAPNQVGDIEQLLELLSKEAARSTWFAVAKRFFLYGGAKEFNPYTKELDRILDYSIALEAALVFENKFVSRLQRERACNLLELEGEDETVTTKLLKDFYGYRSKIAHGEDLQGNEYFDLKQQTQRFECLVREVLRAALKMIPASGEQRKTKLLELADVTDEHRVTVLIQDAKGINAKNRRACILAVLETCEDENDNPQNYSANS